MQDLTPTPAQTVGPFYGYALPFERGGELVPPSREGSIRFHGTVRDGDGKPIPDALIEIWQPDASGSISRQPGSLKRDGYTFTGWGRTPVDDAGHFTFTTVDPGPTREGGAPFILVCVFARGLLDRVFTRAYLPESDALGEDPLLSSVEESRRGTLIAQREPDGGLLFNITLQGEDETVFLSYPQTPALNGPAAAEQNRS
ncbi:protocatechuate 3,4-dioxygenase subunit alpha [Nesterenkonia sp. NBAIMH1]|uniref:protocatechuate 3,4-dioxygenase subunit alpha n=1 Tax=Nesterenkonia sp. NBAIMH1 TaxID=2600320 RepID=UPI0011B5D791|nr:protocatechuate 3,4-dioxygenase subunit alpha [Nesterenkonia sp. NBAIMH1]